MSDAVSPTLRRRRLGSELRRLREAQKKSAMAVARKIGTSQTKLSGAEGARRKLSDDQLSLLLDELAVPEGKAQELRILHQQADQLGWWENYSDVLPDNVELLVGLEAGAAWIREYHEAALPALLQTEEYTHALVGAAFPYLRSTDLPRLVEFRLERQRKLDDPQFRLTVVVNEGALRRWVGGREVMTRQLQHLLADPHQYRATVEVHVLPYEAGEHACLGQEFSLISFPEPEDPETVFLDYGNASGFLEKQSEIRPVTAAFGATSGKVLDLEQSRRRIETIIADLSF